MSRPETPEAPICSPDRRHGSAIRADLKALVAMLRPAKGAEGRRRVYIAGPISEIADCNRQAFELAASRLREEGYVVVNPLEIAAALPFDGPIWADYMRADLHAMLDCDAIFLLPGWQASRGALLEYRVAEALGMEVLHE